MYGHKGSIIFATHSFSVIFKSKQNAFIIALLFFLCAFLNSIGIVNSSYKSAKVESLYNVRADKLN